MHWVQIQTMNSNTGFPDWLCNEERIGGERRGYYLRTESHRARVSNRVKAYLAEHPRLGEANLNWRGGSTPITKLRVNRDSWRRKSRYFVARNPKCSECGSIFNLVAHHRIPWIVSQDDSDSNLMTVCRKCHPVVEREYWRLAKTTAKGLSCPVGASEASE